MPNISTQKKDKEKFKERLIQLYESGVSMENMAKELGITRGTVGRYVKIFELPNRRAVTHKVIDKEKFIEMYDSGATLKSIGNEFGVTPTTIRAYVKRFGLQMRRSNKLKLNDEDKAKIIRMYEAGCSMSFIANEFGVDLSTVRAYVIKMGLPLRGRGRLSRQSKERVAQMITLYKAGVNMSQISKIFGVAQQTVKYTLVKAGVEIDSRRGRRGANSQSKLPNILELKEADRANDKDGIEASKG